VLKLFFVLILYIEIVVQMFFVFVFFLMKGRLRFNITQPLFLQPLRRLWEMPGSNPELLCCRLVHPVALANRVTSHHIPKLSHHIAPPRPKK
jgi:hypothetical protein